MYNPLSTHADEFIDHAEVLETLAEAARKSSDKQVVRAILEKAALQKGLSHREAAILMDCNDPTLEAQLYTLAAEIKQRFYGNRIVLFAPLYLSNYCINGCVYCPYHAKNRSIPRKKLSQEEVAEEVRALIRMGHKRLALEAGEDPVHNPLSYILDSIRTIYDVREGGNSIRRVNVNIAATDVESYRKLKNALDNRGCIRIWRYACFVIRITHISKRRTRTVFTAYPLLFDDLFYLPRAITQINIIHCKLEGSHQVDLLRIKSVADCKIVNIVLREE